MAAMLVELCPLLSIVLPSEGSTVALPDAFERVVMLDGAAGEPALLVSVVVGEGVPASGGGVGDGIVVN